MRTTLTIEPVIALEIRKRMADGARMKTVINNALREGLIALSRKQDKKGFRFKVEPHRFDLRPGIDHNKLNQFADDLEDAERMAKITR